MATTPEQAQRVGYVYDDRYLTHNTGLQMMFGSGRPYPFVDPTLHPSNHRLVMRTHQLVHLSGLAQHLESVDAYSAPLEAITAFHTPEYVDFVRELCANGGGETGLGAPASPESYEVALLGAGGGMAAVDAVMEGRVSRAFANIRPPGHHAIADKGMGFCIFNNVAIAAHHAINKHGLERVMVLDWDVHDGNGTQTAFYSNPQVLFYSLHQDRLFPQDMGLLEQTGDGDGVGYTVNLPLPAGSGDPTYRAAFDEVVLPIADEFKPQLVLISAGQDASVHDPLGRMCLTTAGYRDLTQRMIDVAERNAEGRIVILQEGGYSETYAPYCTLAIIETLAGVRTGIEEPMAVERMSVQPHHSVVGLDARAALDAIKQQHAQKWSALA